MPIIILLSTPPLLYGNENLIWQIGVVDSLYYEFDQSLTPSSKTDINRIVLDKDNNRVWNSSLWADDLANRTNVQEIQFTLPNVRHDRYILTLRCIFRTNRIPSLRIHVNEHSGHYVFSPQLISRLKDISSKYVNNYSYEKADIPIPGQYLKNGINTIQLEAYRPTRHPLDSLSWKGKSSDNPDRSSCAIYWDAIAFAADAHQFAARDSVQCNVSLNPTIFYANTNSGLHEWITADITFRKSLQNCALELESNGAIINKDSDFPYAFGKVRIPFLLPVAGNEISIKWRIMSSDETIAGHASAIPAKKWKLFITPRSHLDVGFTERQAPSIDVHTHSLDKFFSILEGYPEYRWNLEGTRIITEYRKNHDDESYQKLIHHLRHEMLATNSLMASPISYFASLEELFRYNYDAIALRRQYGIPLTTASITDVPTATPALTDVLAHLDIPHLILGANPTRSAPLVISAEWDSRSPFYWQGPGGGKVLLLYSDHFAHVFRFFGFPPGVQHAWEQIPLLMQKFTNPDFKPDAIMMYGLYPDNYFIGEGDADFLTKWNEWFAYPQVRLSTDGEYFEYIQSTFPEYLKTIKGDFGSYWEEDVGMTLREAAEARAAKRLATDAEKLVSMAIPFYTALRYPIEEFQKVWDNITLFTEHTWGSHESNRTPLAADARSELEVKRAFAHNAFLGADALMETGFKHLEGIIDPPANSVLVYNAFNWERSDWVEIELSKDMWIFDDSHDPVSGEIIYSGNDKTPARDYNRIRFFAKNVPPLGVKVYRTERFSTQDFAKSRMQDTTAIETPFYRVSLDSNREFIHSIIDKETGSELIDRQNPYHLNQYLYVSGGENSPIYEGDVLASTSDFEISGSHATQPASVEKTPAGWLITFHYRAPYTPSITTQVRLYEERKRIDISNNIQKEAVETLEGVYFAFPFAFCCPEVRYDIQTGWIDPRRDLLEGACTEWFCIQNAILLSDNTKEILWASPDAALVSLGDIVRGKWGSPFTMDNGTIYSYIMQNYRNFALQIYHEGEYCLNYSMLSGKRLPTGIRLKQAFELTSPLKCYKAKGSVYRIPPDKQTEFKIGNEFSFLTIRPEQVYCVTIKGAEDGKGLICRLLNLGDQAERVSISSDIFSITAAFECKGDETATKPLEINRGSVEYMLGPHRIATVRLIRELITPTGK